MMTFTPSEAAVSLTANVHDMLVAFKAAASIRLQIYPGRPASIFPPSIWQDVRRDVINFLGVKSTNFMDHVMTLELIAVHGLFDTAEAVEQRDAFVDAFVSYVRQNRDVGLAGPNSVLRSMRVVDIPNFTPDWVPEKDRTTYYATLITMEVAIED